MPGQTHEANIKIVGNSGQSFTGRVRLSIEGEAPRPPAAKRPVPPWMVGAAAAGLARLALAAPADIGARYVLSGQGGQAIRSPLYWGIQPVDQAAFVRDFVWVSWWIAPLAIGLYMLRVGDGLRDLVRGLLAGAAAGLAGSASLACLMPLFDMLPSWLWQTLVPRLGMTRFEGHNTFWLILWILEATLTWMVVGALAGRGWLRQEGGPRSLSRLCRAGSVLCWAGLGFAAWRLILSCASGRLDPVGDIYFSWRLATMTAKIHIERMMHRTSVTVAGESVASYALLKLIPTGPGDQQDKPIGLNLALVLDVSARCMRKTAR